MNYAPYYKRILSMIIDAAVIYAIWFGAQYLYPGHYDFGFNIVSLYFINIFITFLCYKNQGRSLGESFLYLSVVFTTDIDKDKKNLYLLLKAFMISSVYVPFSAMRAGAIGFILASVIYLFYPNIREKKLLFWDLASKTAVIDMKASAKLEKQK